MSESTEYKKYVEYITFYLCFLKMHSTAIVPKFYLFMLSWKF